LKKNSLLLLMILFFCGTVFALNIGTDKDSYFLGEKASVFGECSVPIEVRLSSENKTLFTQLVDCKGKSYRTEIMLEPSFPEGEMQIATKTSEQTLSKKISVVATKESRLLGIKVFSPSPEAQTKASSLLLNVEISYLGEKLDNARVFSWNPEGEKVSLNPKGKGVFETTMEIPFDFKNNSWELVVTAGYKDKQGRELGGARTIVLPVEPAIIKANVVKPKSWVFSANVQEEIVVKPAYSNGTPANNPVIHASIGQKQLDFQQNGDNYRALLSFSQEETGYQDLNLSITDSAGNNYSEKITIFVGKSILPPTQDLLLYGGIGLASIVVILWAFFSFRSSRKKSELVEKRQGIAREIEKLQTDYYKRKKMTKDSYDAKMKELEFKLEELKEDLK